MPSGGGPLSPDSVPGSGLWSRCSSYSWPTGGSSLTPASGSSSLDPPPAPSAIPPPRQRSQSARSRQLPRPAATSAASGASVVALGWLPQAALRPPSRPAFPTAPFPPPTDPPRPAEDRSCHPANPSRESPKYAAPVALERRKSHTAPERVVPGCHEPAAAAARIHRASRPDRPTSTLSCTARSTHPRSNLGENSPCVDPRPYIPMLFPRIQCGLPEGPATAPNQPPTCSRTRFSPSAA